MTEQHPSESTFAQNELRIQIEEALAIFDIDELIVDVARDGTIALRGVVADDETRHAVLQRASNVAGQPVNGDALGTRSLVSYPPEALDPQMRAGVRHPDAAIELGIDRPERDGTEIDFNDEIGTTDVMRSISENEPWTPPSDPVVEPSDRPEGIEVVGGFAADSMTGRFETGDDPDRLQTGDGEIEEDVRVSLQRDAATAHLEIDVRVRSGVVLLTGTVQSLDDVESAEEVASRVPGVVEVREQLQVEGFESA